MNDRMQITSLRSLRSDEDQSLRVLREILINII